MMKDPRTLPLSSVTDDVEAPPQVERPAELYGGEGEPAEPDREAERARAERLAERYRLGFVEMEQFQIDHELFRSIPADLMLRYGFVPYRREGQTLVIVVSDPTDLPMIDELALLLATPVKVTVGTPSAIGGYIRKWRNFLQSSLRLRHNPANLHRGNQRHDGILKRPLEP